MQNFFHQLSGSALIVAFFLVQLAGIFAVPFGFPGPLVQALAAIGLNAATHGARMPWYWAAVFFAVGLAAELLDIVAGQMGSKKFGGSKRAAWGALIGGFAGAFCGGFIPIPLLGSVIASFIGTFLGAIAGEMRNQNTLDPKVRVGIGAVLGRAIGVGVKLFTAFAILIASIAVVVLS